MRRFPTTCITVTTIMIEASNRRTRIRSSKSAECDVLPSAVLTDDEMCTICTFSRTVVVKTKQCCIISPIDCFVPNLAIDSNPERIARFPQRCGTTRFKGRDNVRFRVVAHIRAEEHDRHRNRRRRGGVVLAGSNVNRHSCVTVVDCRNFDNIVGYRNGCNILVARRCCDCTVTPFRNRRRITQFALRQTKRCWTCRNRTSGFTDGPRHALHVRRTIFPRIVLVQRECCSIRISICAGRRTTYFHGIRIVVRPRRGLFRARIRQSGCLCWNLCRCGTADRPRNRFRARRTVRPRVVLIRRKDGTICTSIRANGVAADRHRVRIVVRPRRGLFGTIVR